MFIIRVRKSQHYSQSVYVMYYFIQYVRKVAVHLLKVLEGYPLHSSVSPSIPLPCVTMFHHSSTGLYRSLSASDLPNALYMLRYACTHLTGWSEIISLLAQDSEMFVVSDYIFGKLETVNATVFFRWREGCWRLTKPLQHKFIIDKLQ